MEVEETAVARQSRGADPGAVENKNDTHSKEECYSTHQLG